MSSCTLYLVRHGQSVHNRDTIVSGHVDPALTDEGRQQAADTKKQLENIHFDAAYSSDLQRAYETAEIIHSQPVPDHHRFKELRERNFGSVDGQPSHQLASLQQQRQAGYDALASTEDRWRFKLADDIESDHEVSERFVQGLEKIAKTNLGKTVLVVAHGGSLRVSLIKLGYGSVAELPSGCVANAAYAKVVYDGKNFTVTETYGITKHQQA